MEEKMVPRILAKLARTGYSPNLKKMGVQASALAYKDSLPKKKKEGIEKTVGTMIHSQKELGFHMGSPSSAKKRNVPSVKKLNIELTKKRLMSLGKWNSSKRNPVQLKSYEGFSNRLNMQRNKRPLSERVYGSNPAFKHYFMQKSDMKNKIHRSFSGKIRTES